MAGEPEYFISTIFRHVDCVGPIRKIPYAHKETKDGQWGYVCHACQKEFWITISPEPTGDFLVPGIEIMRKENSRLETEIERLKDVIARIQLANKERKDDSG